MPALGPMEMLVVAVVALIVFGPQRLPDIARTIGRTLNEFRRQAADIRAEFESGLDDPPEQVGDEPSEPGPVTDDVPTSPVQDPPADESQVEDPGPPAAGRSENR